MTSRFHGIAKRSNELHIDLDAHRKRQEQMHSQTRSHIDEQVAKLTGQMAQVAGQVSTLAASVSSMSARREGAAAAPPLHLVIEGSIHAATTSFSRFVADHDACLYFFEPDHRLNANATELTCRKYPLSRMLLPLSPRSPSPSSLPLSRLRACLSSCCPLFR